MASVDHVRLGRCVSDALQLNRTERPRAMTGPREIPAHLDEDLFRQAQEGDLDALRQFLEFAWHWVPAKTRQCADLDEAVNEAWLKLMEQLPSKEWKGQREWIVYCARTLRSVVGDEARKTGRVRTGIDEVSERQLDGMTAEMQAEAKDAYQWWSSEVVRRLPAHMKGLGRQILELKKAGCTAPEIAVQLGKDVEEVRRCWRRMRDSVAFPGTTSEEEEPN